MAMALIAILSAVTVLSMAFYLPNVRLKSATQEINIHLRKARLEDLQSGRVCHVEVHKVLGVKPFVPLSLSAEMTTLQRAQEMNFSKCRSSLGCGDL